MGLLDAVTGMLGAAGGAPAGGQAALVNAVIDLLGQGGGQGGLAGLVRQFEQAGLGEHVASWVSTGQNLPVSAEQITQALGGSGGLAQIAERSGLPLDGLAGPLSQLLPQLVDQLTPNGQLPADGAALPQLDLGHLLGGLLGGR